MMSNIGVGTILRNCAAAFALTATLLFAAFVFVSSVGTRALEAQSEPSATATLQGMVRDSDVRPVVGASVYLQSAEAQTLGGPFTVLTDASGAYRFSAVRQGVYALRAEAAGCGEATLKSFTLAAKESRTIDLTLKCTKTSERPKSSTVLPEFFDEPHFTVASVTDTTSLGGHPHA